MYQYSCTCNYFYYVPGNHDISVISNSYPQLSSIPEWEVSNCSLICKEKCNAIRISFNASEKIGELSKIMFTPYRGSTGMACTAKQGKIPVMAACQCRRRLAFYFEKLRKDLGLAGHTTYGAPALWWAGTLKLRGIYTFEKNYQKNLTNGYHWKLQK